MKKSQYDYSKNPKNKESDRQLLLNRSFSERCRALQSIGPKYGVKIFPVNASDPKCTDFIRQCPKHGDISVKLATMTVRGNFACHHCINEIQGELCKAAMSPELDSPEYRL